MTATAAPFGLRPVHHISGQQRVSAYRGNLVINSGQTLYNGTPIVYTPSSKTFAQVNANTTSGGTAANAVCMGAFAGIEYDDVDGRRQFRTWIAATTTISTTANIVIYVADDPNLVFEIQASGSLAEGAAGLQYNFTNITAGSTVTGQSGCTLDTTAIATTKYGHFLVTELFNDVGNAWGDTYTIVRGLLVAPQRHALRPAAL